MQSTCTHVHILRAGRLVYAGALAELEQQRPSTSLRIGLNAPPPIAELEQLPRVTQVEELGEGQFRLHHSPGALLHRILVELAYDHGWDLWELTPERESLEQMFVNLTLNQETAG